MKSTDWKKIEHIFHNALEIPLQERQSFLVKECSGDFGMLTEVQSLLQSFEEKNDFLEESAVEYGFAAIHDSKKLKLENKKIGDYRIEAQIGSGGMGEVYKAFDTKLNRYVALKFLSESIENDFSAKNSLIREAQAAAALDHPNICAVYGIEEKNGHRFIVMQYIDGKTLDECFKEKRISEPEFRAVAKQIVSAVGFAHLHGIVHRDLKPANIMLTNDGQIKILDFGLAKVLQKKTGLEDEPNANQSISRHGLVIGTIAYMSPEQLRGEKIDFRSDIFSIGVILDEILNQKNPFKRGSQAETIAAILSENNGRTIENKTEYSPQLNAIIEKCLQKKASDRFQSAAELLLELNTEVGNAKAKTFSNEFFRNAVLVLCGIVIIWSFVFYFNRQASQKTISLVPITFTEQVPDKEYLAEGLTLSIVEKLSNLYGVKIKKAVDKKFVNLQSVGTEMKTDAVFTGEISKRGEELYLKTTLVKSSDGKIIDTFEQKIDEANLIDLQEKVSNRITDTIKTSLTDEDLTKLTKKATKNEEANRLYFLGRYYLNRKQGNDVTMAIDAFSQAKELDPAFAKAWAGLADSYFSQSLPWVEHAISPTEAVNYSKTAANTALLLDKDLSESYNSLGLINSKYDWNWTEAESNFRAAIERDPNFEPAYINLIGVLNLQGRFIESIETLNKLKVINSLLPAADMELAKIYYLTRQYSEMEKMMPDLIRKNPNNIKVSVIQSYLFLKTGKYQEAIDILEKIYNDGKAADKVFASAPLGYAYAKIGKHEIALRLIKNLDEYKDVWVPAQEKAVIYVGLGDFDKAFEMLEKSCQEKYPPFPPLMIDPLIDDVLNNPKMKKIRQCAHLG
ncbi:MAG TPA: protein kinase [Pyrinomonadaceae bacterium]|nr:protein kinase [Pyrinomonadaceae bacterium]